MNHIFNMLPTFQQAGCWVIRVNDFLYEDHCRIKTNLVS